MTFFSINHTPDAELRRKIIYTAQKMNALGINQGKSGNVSARADNGFLITPTGIAYDETKPEQIVETEFDGSFAGDVLPSSEWRFHADIYCSRADVHAIVHTHSTFATTLACTVKVMPAFHYMIAAAGGADIRVAPYATFGTQELSDHAVTALDGRNACLLAQHGMIAVGATLEKTLALAVEVESLSRMYWQALQIGEPPVLDNAEMAIVIEKFRTYGQQGKN
jgi:L-fuculose-phosphate aldolase